MSDVGELLDLTGRVALVTGASRGIGAASATLLARAGASVGLVARSGDALADVASTIPDGRSVVVEADLARPDDIKRAVDEVNDAWGKIDILVNNAGAMAAAPYRDIAAEDWDHIINVNLTAIFALVRLVVPGMEERGWGRVVNITSITAQTGGVSGGVHYSASKGGLAAMTRTLARDVASAGVTVNAIAPGQIDTRPDLLTDEEKDRRRGLVPLGRLGYSEDIANAVLFLASSMADYITGATI
ncbi:MAG: SDR family oxidoreductase, partial [Nitriliruptoraceae bacterium]